MEVILLALVICLILALKPVKGQPDKERLYPPAISRKMDDHEVRSAYQFPKLNSQFDEVMEINSSEIARQKQSITRVRFETFEFNGRIYLAIEQNGVLIIREDS